MNLGFDAKRAFHNDTGLGHYSRTLLHSLADYFPEHQYFLFNPKKSRRFYIPGNNFHEVLPRTFLHRLLTSAWRSSWVKSDLERLGINLYHGLSHEIPVGIRKTGIPSVVTIHDLIHERYPEQYNKIDVKIYSKKFRYACENANHVIAISKQTMEDVKAFYNIPEERITVCYQSCNPAFAIPVDGPTRNSIRSFYRLPEEYFLYVGSIIERKNLLNICKAMFLLRNVLDVPLVVIGNGHEYKRKVTDYVRQNGLENKIIFLSDRPEAKASSTFRNAKDFPAIYQSAVAMIYPSYFEGFGIPVLEALMSSLPVITSNVSCLPEAGGDGAYYVDPNSAEEIAAGMKKIYEDRVFAASQVEKGLLHASRFSQQKTASAVMDVYKRTW